MAQNTPKNTPKKRRDNTHGERNIGISILKWFGASIGTLLMVILVTGVMFACIFVVYCQNYLADTAIDVSVEDLTLNETSYIYYYDKDSGRYEVLDTLFIENRTWVSYDELPEYIFQALVAIEDHRFWDHHGVDWYRTIGAAYNIFLGDGSTFGGSTITQQVIKNTTGKDEVTVRRKLTEIFSALQFDKKYGKETTLEVYINLVYFSQGCHGIEAAAQTYFGKHASELSLAEAASIVGITNLPTYYDPYQNRDNNKTRQETILYAMKNYGYITDEEYQAAKAEKLVFKRDVQSSESSSTTNKKVQSYFVDQVIEDVIEDLMEQRGVSRRIAQNYLYTGGYKIYVTMDTDVQKVIDEVYTNPEYWPALSDADELEQPPQSAIVVVDNSSGKVLGMYGGLGEKTGDRVRNRATQMTKQPGSSIKPLAVYAPALEAGLLNPSSVMTDMPAMLDGANKPYPKNYDRIYRGQMTIMEAVQRSNNTIPVQLVRTMGPERCFEFAKYKMGLSTLVEGEYRGDKYFSDAQIASMALGGLTDGVTVEDMAAAYAVFPNAGVYNEPYTYTKVEDSSGNVILEHSDEGTAVISERTAFYMNNMLQNVITNGTGMNARLSNMPAGGKTGTTDEDYDRWFVGYTPYYSCAVWYGFDYNHQIKTVSGTSPAVPLWQAVMEKLHENLEKKEFFTPENEEIVKVGYCRDSGLLASDACRADARGSRVLTGTFYASDVPHEVCSVHRFVDVCGESGQLATEHCPAETRTQIAMMDLDRRFDTVVTISDEQYTVRLPGVDYTQPDENGLYRAISAPNKDGSPLKNELCTIHGEDTPPDDPNDDPDVSEFPTEPDDPDVSPDPNASTEPSSEPSDEPSFPPIEDYPSESPSPPPEFPTEPDDEPSEEPQP